MKKLKMSHNVRMKFDRLYNGSQRHTDRRLSPTIQMIHLIFPPHVRRSGVTAWLPISEHLPGREEARAVKASRGFESQCSDRPNKIINQLNSGNTFNHALAVMLSVLQAVDGSRCNYCGVEQRKLGGPISRRPAVRIRLPQFTWFRTLHPDIPGAEDILVRGCLFVLAFISSTACGIM